MHEKLEVTDENGVLRPLCESLPLRCRRTSSSPSPSTRPTPWKPGLTLSVSLRPRGTLTPRRATRGSPQDPGQGATVRAEAVRAEHEER